MRESEERFSILTEEPEVGKSAIATYPTQTRTDIFAYHFRHLKVEETVCPSQVLRSLAAQLDQTSSYYNEALVNTIKSMLSREAYISIDKILSNLS